MQSNSGFHTVRGYQLLNKESGVLTSAMEDYLEMIYRNSLSEGYIRINSLASLLHVKPSSATKMVQRLNRLGILEYQKYGIIFLTERGREIGRSLLERHDTVEQFLRIIGADDDILLQTELIEHSISRRTLGNLRQLVLFFESDGMIADRFNEFKAITSD